jgi:hypothetical protein
MSAEARFQARLKDATSASIASDTVLAPTRSSLAVVAGAASQAVRLSWSLKLSPTMLKIIEVRCRLDSSLRCFSQFAAISFFALIAAPVKGLGRLVQFTILVLLAAMVTAFCVANPRAQAK